MSSERQRFSARSQEYIVQAAVAQDGLALEYASARWAVPDDRMLDNTTLHQS